MCWCWRGIYFLFGLPDIISSRTSDLVGKKHMESNWKGREVGALSGVSFEAKPVSLQGSHTAPPPLHFFASQIMGTLRTQRIDGVIVPNHIVVWQVSLWKCISHACTGTRIWIGSISLFIYPPNDRKWISGFYYSHTLGSRDGGKHWLCLNLLPHPNTFWATVTGWSSG